ncbi:hypothetical protein NDU88_004417 [Pleurodeles waltl]|uniref:Uncharacterized protein n=1 Tax=Pleurodeles waltl TaxID=8319 RepID=A0AAV7WWH9_PLEWA|nr:hypothetical protein NDU88_004417 [Pleurodeles waltl]
MDGVWVWGATAKDVSGETSRYVWYICMFMLYRESPTGQNAHSGAQTRKVDGAKRKAGQKIRRKARTGEEGKERRLEMRKKGEKRR